MRRILLLAVAGWLPGARRARERLVPRADRAAVRLAAGGDRDRRRHDLLLRLHPTGAIYTGDLSTGAGKVAIQGAPGRAATGMKVDHGHLWVSGASTGKAFVYDLKTGGLLREYQLATGGDPTFVNDVVVTRKAAYFTDSSRPVLYRVALGSHGAPGDATALPLGGDYQHLGGFNLNGIDATPDGKTLLAVQSANGRLYAIDAKTGAAHTVALGGVALTNGDGILLRAKTLYVVQNQLNRIAVLGLRDRFRSGSLDGHDLRSGLRHPPQQSSATATGCTRIDARFGTPPTPTTPYAVVQTGD